MSSCGFPFWFMLVPQKVDGSVWSACYVHKVVRNYHNFEGEKMICVGATGILCSLLFLAC